MKTCDNRGGGLIAFVIIMAIIFSIGAMSVLYGAMAEVRLSRGQRWRAQARHLVEAEMVKVRERLFRNPTDKTPTGMITVMDGHTFDVTATISTCSSGTNCADKILVRVAY